MGISSFAVRRRLERYLCKAGVLGENRKSAVRKAGARSLYSEDERHRARRGREKFRRNFIVTESSANFDIIHREHLQFGVIAQLARALPLQGRGPGFESLLLHQ